MSKYSKAYFNPYSDSFSCRVAIVSPEVLQEAEQRLAEFPGGMESAMKRAMATFPEKLFAQSRTSRLAIAISTALKQKSRFVATKSPYSAMAAHLRASQPSIQKRPSWQSLTAIFARFIRALPQQAISFFQQLRLSLITPLSPQSKQEPAAKLIRVFLNGLAGGWLTAVRQSKKLWVRPFHRW